DSCVPAASCALIASEVCPSSRRRRYERASGPGPPLERSGHFPVAVARGARLRGSCGRERLWRRLGKPDAGPDGARQRRGAGDVDRCAGDFLSYQLAVVSLKLTRADGTAVETLPAPSKVDFAQLANLSEVISARQVSAGTYTAVSMTVDYGGGTIVVDNGAGGITVPAANI